MYLKSGSRCVTNFLPGPWRVSVQVHQNVWYVHNTVKECNKITCACLRQGRDHRSSEARRVR